MAVSDWSTTPASNNSAAPNGAPEGMLPGGLNDTMRKVMADVRSLHDDATTPNTSAKEIGYKGVPVTNKASNYTLALTDAYTCIYHASADGSGDTYTIPANSSVAFPVGSFVMFANLSSNSVSIAITTDTLTLEGTTSTGSRTLGQNGRATAFKITTTQWLISGTALT